MMMKLSRLIFAFIFLTTATANAQTTAEQIKILEDFLVAPNDSEFVTKYSVKPFVKYNAERYQLAHTFDPTDSLVFNHHQKGDLLGPYIMDSLSAFIKVLEVDSALRMRTGNIYLNPEKRGKDSTDKLAKTILASVKKKGNYDELCHQYQDDENKGNECDLGWFFQKAMVYEFEKAVLKHKKGDCFIVETQFGKHVVKVLDNPVKDRFSVTYTVLYLKNVD